MLKFYTAGESHGQALFAYVSGLPAQLPIDLKFINNELHRRQLGYGRGGRQKIEKDTAEIFAGVRHGKTIGAPIALRIENRDWANWEKILPVEPAEDDPGTKKLNAPRPGHADLDVTRIVIIEFQRASQVGVAGPGGDQFLCTGIVFGWLNRQDF